MVATVFHQWEPYQQLLAKTWTAFIDYAKSVGSTAQSVFFASIIVWVNYFPVKKLFVEI